MATQFTQQATAQLDPVYSQQISGLQGQIPQIQNLYKTLTDALTQQNQLQLNTGVQQIGEDAARRGVLRSSLPTDARTSLTAELGAALNQSLGQLGIQQADKISGIQQSIADIRVNRAQAIADLARNLETQDIERQKLAETIRSNRAQEAISRRGSGGGGGTPADPTATFRDSFKNWFDTQVKNNGGRWPSRQSQDNYINSLFSRYGVRDTGARQVVWDAINSQFGRPDNPAEDFVR